MPLVEAEHLGKTYTIDERELRVLDDVSLSINAGEFVAITGSSGSGKTTLLTLLSGLDSPSEGRVVLDGNDITNATEDALAPLRNQLLGFVFQSFHLVPSMTALENVMFPAELCRSTTAEQDAHVLLKRVGLEARMHNLPTQLSGGEKQRVALCRALVNRPKLLFADEPTGNLDSKNGDAVLRLLIELQAESDCTLILVTHNPSVADAAERRLHLADGRVIEGG